MSVDGPITQSVYYLSFHILPQQHVRWGDSVKIAPNVQNDLREQVYVPHGEGDENAFLKIGLAWLQEGLDGQFHFLMKADAIEWTGPNQAFRPIEVPLPHRSLTSAKQDVEIRLRLVLYHLDLANVTQQSGNILLGIYDLHCHKDRNGTNNSETIFVPCFSPQIVVTKGKLACVPDDNLPLRLFNLNSNDTQSSQSIRMYEQPGFALEGHLWDAALDLVCWILRNTRKKDWQAKRVVELGAGTGLVSIALSRYAQADVTATDLSSGMELLTKNLRINDGGKKEGVVLDWNDDGSRSEYDVVLVADCTYNPAYFSSLCRAIYACLKSSKGVCYLAKKHRHVDEDLLWPALQAAGLSYQLIAGMDSTRKDSDDEYSCTGSGIYRIQKLTAMEHSSHLSVT